MATNSPLPPGSFPGPTPGGGLSLRVLGLLLVLLVLPMAALYRASVWVDWRWIAGILLATNLFLFFAFRSDKRRAARGAPRIPEFTLHVTELLGGWPGGFLAQRLFRHKTSKFTYQLVFWLIVGLHQLIALDAVRGWQLSSDAWMVIRHFTAG